ncbi:efflux RND transporter periplasmic adaptor subunit [Pediococcus acidilactici]|uniref:efflux RND transporter periplasmic adaptor subunit n=1 Tax=Pediococcus acidilactici TaxID=1254 RepID=UPI001BD2AB12|nr:efflux RND transporter periplasmic adaptor subunit [Pediococcus acidilactici]MBS9400074.1 efflux RND transporter periplasmic adaptor subunit [Pediococcus acidilactici]
MKKNWYIICLAIISISLILFLFLETPSKKDGSTSMKTYTLQREPSLQMSGQIEPREVQHITEGLPKNTKIDEVEYSEDQKVPAGAVVLKYHYENADNLENNAKLNLLRKEQQKILNAYQNNQASDEDVIKLSQINKSIDDLNNNLQEHFISAKFTGYYQREHDKDIKIISAAEEIETEVTEFDYSKLKAGDKVRIKVLPLNKTITGSIRSVSLVPIKESTAPSKYKVIVEPDDYIQFGFSTKVIVDSKSIVVPHDCVVGNNVLIKKGKNNTKWIENAVYKNNGSYIARKDKLSVGDRVVVHPK